MVPALTAGEVAVMTKENDAAFGITRCRCDCDLDPILVGRGENRERHVSPDANRPRCPRPWNPFDAIEDFGAFGIHERRGHLGMQDPDKGEEDDCSG